jgi:ABC-type nitrate/sulfonate/bicarbonate transport system substrate-binding protein
MTTLTLALDWRPNTNHTGFFVAKHLGYYKDLGLDVNIISTEEDNYALTPAKKVELGLADFALCPLESVISYRTKERPLNTVAIGTVFKEDISAICTLKSSGLDRPKKLDNRVYASYNARYEDRIVQQMIKNDGGRGDVHFVHPEKLGIWDTLLSGDADATWIFVNWEGVEAESQNIDLNLFKMSDFGVPYGYSPVIMTTEDLIASRKSAYKSFMSATKKGFQYASSHYEYSADILNDYISKSDRYVDLHKSQIMTSPSYGDPDHWGIMDLKKVQKFIDWLSKQKLERTKLKADTIATNTLLS